MLNISDVKIGARVRCTYMGTSGGLGQQCVGKVGIITNIQRDPVSSSGLVWTVKDHNGDVIGAEWFWCSLSSFELDSSLSSKDIKVGTRVKCILAGSPSYGSTGVIVNIKPDATRTSGLCWTVMSDDGEEFGIAFCWHKLESFELASHINTRPMVSADRKVGTKVICRFDNWSGQLGTIVDVDCNGEYLVKRPNGTHIGEGSYWSYSSSFDVIIDDIAAEPVVVTPKTVVAPAPIEKKPCPMAYYGIAPCICGKCAKPKPNPFFVKI